MMLAPHQNSKVTVELREVIESGVDLWAFDYPSYYKGEAKKAFEQKVLDHFWLRQIGAETVGRFLFYFRRTMREIMPLYIQRYESVDLMKDPEIRPLDNYNMIEEYQSTGSNSNITKSESEDNTKGNVTTGGSNTSKATEVHSDTPQGKLNISIPAFPTSETKSETINHASDATQTFGGQHSTETSDSVNEGSSKASAEVKGQNIESHKLTRRGNIGVTTYAQLLEGYRQTFLNIDMEIINELESCFLGVF